MAESKEQLLQYAQNPNVRKMLDLLAYTEGTDNLHGYNTLVGGKKIDDLSNHPNVVGLKTKDGASTAFGRYQITGTTWKGLKDKYGFEDFTPETQDLAAIALLKQSGALAPILKGDYKSAVDKSKNVWVSLPNSSTKNQPEKSWGEVNKFLGSSTTHQELNPEEFKDIYGKTKRKLDQEAEASDPWLNIYKAYKSGKMSTQEKTDFEQYVASGAVSYPKHMPVGNSPQSKTVEIVDQGVIEAYRSGVMTPQERSEFEVAVKNKVINVPKGFKLLPPPKEMSTLEKVKDFFTGESKQTSDTRMLPGIEEMPELNSFSWESVKNTVGNIFSDKDETMRIIKANSPNVQIKKDEKGNYLLKSAIDGKWYANQPGVRESGLTGLAVQTGIGALTGGGSTLLRAAGLGAASQAGVEGLQSAVGGEFDPTQVAIAGALGGAVPAAVGLVKAAKTPINNIIKRGVTQDITTLPHTPPIAATTPEVAPITPAATQPIYNDVGVTKELLPAQNLATTIRKASDSGVKSKAAKILAEQASPDPELLDSARRLGIEEYLQPDHITTNQVYRELAQAVKSNPGSEARASEIAGLKEVAKRADDIITEIGSKDASEVSATIKDTMRQTQEELEKKAEELYGKLRGSIPEDYRFEPKTVLGFIETQAKKVDGVENLTPTEKYIYRRLSPKAVKDMAGNVIEDARMPLYTNVDDVRKKIMSGNKGQGLFKDEDKGLLKKLYSSLVEDQATAAKYHGQEELFNTARETVKVRKSLEDDMQSLFGKELDRSMTRLIVDATKSLPAGDADKFVKLIKLVPEAQRKDTVAASLLTAFGKNARNGELNFNSYTNWFEGLQRNKQSYAAIMSNLPKESVQQLKDLYKVSKGISLASKERITTGRINAAKKLIDDTDTLMGNVYSAVKKSYVGAGLEFVTTPLGMPGAGVVGALSSALTRGKIPAMKKADELLASYEFQSLVKNLNTEARPAAVRKVANSRKFIDFLKSIKVDYKNQSQRVKFLNSLLQATNNKRDKDASNKR